MAPSALPTAPTDKATPHPNPLPFYYSLLAQQEATRVQPPLQQPERHIAAAQSESLLRLLPFVNLSAYPLYFGTVLSAPPALALPPYYCSMQGFPADGSPSLVSDVLRVDRARFVVRDGDTENEPSDEKSEKTRRLEEGDCPGEARSRLAERCHAQNVPAPSNGPVPCECIMSPSVALHEEASNATSETTSGEEEAERVAVPEEASSVAYNNRHMSADDVHTKVVSAQKPCGVSCYGSSSCVSLEELLKHEVKKPSVGAHENSSASGMDECVTRTALADRPLHGHFQQFCRLFLSSGMSDTLRLRSLAADESGVVSWIEITRKVSHIDPAFGPVDAARILVSSNGLCKLQLVYPFVRTVRTRLMPNTQEDVDSLLAELGPQSVLCPGIQDYECRFPAFGPHLPLHVRVTDTLNGTKRYDHERCPLWHVPAQSLSVPGQWGLHYVCRCCRQMDGILSKLSAQPRAHSKGMCRKGTARRMYALGVDNTCDSKQLATEMTSKEMICDGECTYVHVSVHQTDKAHTIYGIINQIEFCKRFHACVHVSRCDDATLPLNSETMQNG